MPDPSAPRSQQLLGVQGDRTHPTGISRTEGRIGKVRSGGLSSEEVERLRAERAEVAAERDDYRDTVDALLSDCDRYLKRIKELEAKFSPETRDRILAALGVGKQSPIYKRVKAILEQMMP